MELTWKFDMPANTLTCVVDSTLSYRALHGGCDGLIKIYNGVETHIPSEEWHLEKEWLSENYSEVVGTFEDPSSSPPTPDPKFLSTAPAVFGLSSDGDYLDRLQRSSQVMSNNLGNLMAPLGFVEGVGTFETPNGVDIYLRSWHTANDHWDWSGQFNTMPCCVFPDNPGWQKITLEEFHKYFPDIDPADTDCSNVDLDLLNKHFVLP